MKDFEDKYQDGGSMKTLTTDLDEYFDYDVTDNDDHKVGTLNSLWVDRGGHPLFLGIKTGWVFGKTHVVPTEIAKVNQRSHSIQLPISEDTIKGAPTFEGHKELEVDEEREVYRYFHIEEPAAESRLDLASRSRRGTDVKVPTAEAVTTPLAPPKAAPPTGIAAKGAAVAGAAATGVAATGAAAARAAEREADSAKTAAREAASKEAAMASQKSSAGIASTGMASQPSAATREARPEAEEGRMALSEESLKVGKKIVDAGGVRLRKVIRTQTVSQPVELSHEEIVIERVPAQGAQPGGVEAFVEKEVYIALHREEPVVQKECRVREEVRARKQPQIEKRTVSDSIRKEDVEVVKDADQAAQANPKPK